MGWPREWFIRLWATLRPTRSDADLEEELRLHLELAIEAERRHTDSADEARRSAMLRVGPLTQSMEVLRDQRGLRSIEDLIRDLRHGVRTLRLNRTFAIAVVVSLALGLGANTAMFSLVNALLLRTIPVDDPDRLVRIATDSGQGGAPGPVPSAIVDLIKQEHLFSNVCGFLATASTVLLDQHASMVASHAVTGSCFATLGLRTTLGRPVTEDDDRPESPAVVVLAYDTWQRDFGGDPAVIGRMLRMEAGTFQIVGVTERSFQGLMLGVPVRLILPITHLDVRTSPPVATPPMDVFARLPPDTTVEHVRARLTALWPHWLERSVPTQLSGAARERYLKRSLIVTDAASGVDYSLRWRFRAPLVGLLAISAIVLLITCINVANLLLARAAERRRDVALRTALGASRWDLVRHALAEIVPLLLAGAAVGVIVSFWIDRLLVRIFIASAPGFALDVTPDARVLAFTALASTIAFAVFAIVSTLVSHRMHDGASGPTSERVIGQPGRLRQGIIVAQVALTMVLVAAGHAFVQEFQRLQTEPLGIELEQLLSVQLLPVPGGYQPPFDSRTYFPDLLHRIGSIPGVRSVALSRWPVLLGNDPQLTPARAITSDQEVGVEQMIVSDAFFSTIGIPFIAGSSFDRHGAPGDARRTAVVSESTARALFDTTQVIGDRIRVGETPLNQSLEIIGVAADAVVSSPQRRNLCVVYLNFWQAAGILQGRSDLLVRTDREPLSLAEAVRRIVFDAGHEFVWYLRPLTDHRALVQEHLLAAVSGAFGVVGLALAAIGLYGVLAFSVVQRTAEIGIRMALGADRVRVLGLVLRDAAILVGAGLCIGMPLAWWTTRLATTTMSSGGSIPIASVLTALVVMLAVSMASVCGPAWRAASIDPIQALRHE